MTALLLLAVGQSLASDLDATLNVPSLQGARVGVVVSEPDGHVLYSKNPDVRMLPASNEKLFTCAYALHELGANYRPKTLFWREHDRLVVRSTGDPLMPYETLKSLAHKLNPRRKPVEVSESYRAGYPGGWQLADLPNRYAAPVYALTVDRGSLELWSHHGKPQLRPAPFDIAVQWRRKSGKLSDQLDVFHHRLTIEGAMPKVDKLIDTLGLPDTDYQAASLLGRHVRFVTAVPARKPDFIYLGAPLAKTMRTCLQMSDNNLAENFLLIAAGGGGTLVDPYNQALPKLAKFLKECVGLSDTDILPDDGCGMSRHNLVTPAAIAAILRWSLTQPTAALWRSMLDRPGSGTMKHRLHGVAFEGKTGTMEHVSALSGYLKIGARTVIVSVMLNGYLCKTAEAKKLENLLVKHVAANISGGTNRAIE